MPEPPPYVIVLAGGDGQRLRAAAKTRFGVALPKQFCPWDGERTMIDRTMDQASSLTPADHVFVSCVETHRPMTEVALRSWPRSRRIYQPSNRDTGPGILLPLCHVAHEEPGAVVVVLPSDHYVADASQWADGVNRAIDIAREGPDRVFLLGASPDRPETDYGWIVPFEDPDDGWQLVRQFREKPSLAEARRLFSEGALWNTLIVVARARPLWSLFAACAMQWTEALQACTFHEENLRRCYEELPPFNVSRDVLEPSCDRLAVVPLDECGWSDWGTEERIERSLRERREHVEVGAGAVRSPFPSRKGDDRPC
ncbi:MAG: NTP transferase domain-containing protein [Planctomycetes bacterium]|nr:NTP transferase domain-containing protein [Planctomycetota bacterium]